MKVKKAGKFQHRELVYNRNTNEGGAVRRVYERSGVTMYVVAVPTDGHSWALGSYISDWAEGVLQLSNNERLKSSTLEMPASDLFITYLQ